jgi:branched-chain amino acid transport system substrate-binding protein
MRSMREAHSTDPKRVEALKSHRFDTVLGEVGFDAKGDINAPGYGLYVWKGDKYEYAN